MELKINPVPTLELEQQLLNSGCKLVAGVDEVGRGALAGPVSVGIAVVDLSIKSIPEKLRDSKLISKTARENLIPRLQDWSIDYAIGHASPSEIDKVGIVGALVKAWQRAFEQLGKKPDHLILDGKHNWLAGHANISVTMKIKADQNCASVAAASVLAKVERDGLMQKASVKYPNYGFDGNVGYGSAKHMAAIKQFGATKFHRRSWNLPTSD